MPKKLINFEFLKENTFGNTAYMLELLDLFMATTRPMLDELKKLCSEQQWDALRKVSHKLRSNYSILGVVEVETILKELESFDGNFNENKGICKSVDQIIEITAVVYKELTKEVEILKK